MVSHPETGSDLPIGSDRESGCDRGASRWGVVSRYSLCIVTSGQFGYGRVTIQLIVS